MISHIVAILGGLIVAAPFITAKAPSARPFISKLAPYEEWIGIFLTLFGLLGVLGTLASGNKLSVKWLLLGAKSVSMFAVGFLLAYRLIVKHLLSKSADAMSWGQVIRARLTYYQVYLGRALIILTLLTLIRIYLP